MNKVKKTVIPAAGFGTRVEEAVAAGITDIFSDRKHVEKMQYKVRRMDMYHALEKTVAYIDENFADPVALEKVSLIAGVSESYLNALFVKELGISPKKYLQNPCLCFEEVAAMCGYTDANYFSLKFHGI